MPIHRYAPLPIRCTKQRFSTAGEGGKREPRRVSGVLKETKFNPNVLRTMSYSLMLRRTELG